MKRMTTKMSTVTPKSTLTKSQPVGQGVKNIGKAKKYGPMSMAMGKKAAAEGAVAGTIMRKAVKTSNEMPQLMRRSAKVLPEVKVTAPKPQRRLALKVTSRRK